jgi:hypothetical protein
MGTLRPTRGPGITEQFLRIPHVDDHAVLRNWQLLASSSDAALLSCQALGGTGCGAPGVDTPTSSTGSAHGAQDKLGPAEPEAEPLDEATPSFADSAPQLLC